MEMDEDNVVSDHDEDAQTDGDAALASVRLGQALGTPYHLSAAAKAHLRSRIQTPGMPVGEAPDGADAEYDMFPVAAEGMCHW